VTVKYPKDEDCATLYVGPDDNDGNSVIVKVDGKYIGPALWVMETIKRHYAEVETSIALARLRKVA